MADTIQRWLEALPGAQDLLFWPPPASLYTVAKLYDGLRLEDFSSWRSTWDSRVHHWTLGPDGRARALDAVETTAIRLHDAAMDRLVRDYLDHDRATAVGVMGGHAVLRNEPAYEQVASIARALRRKGFKIVTGGGPGLMEAANLGAFLAPYADTALETALVRLRTAPDCGGDPDPTRAEAQRRAWIGAAAAVRASLCERWDAEPRAGGDSLGLPTWYYGSEPPNLFASLSGKYFLNSLREDGLVSVANGGLIFGKGAAGTVQEVFQNASYNYYRGAGVDPTPMVFLGTDFWSPHASGVHDPERKPVYPLIHALAGEARPPFTGSLLLSDDSGTIVDFLAHANASRQRRAADMSLASVNALPPRPRP